MRRPRVQRSRPATETSVIPTQISMAARRLPKVFFDRALVGNSEGHVDTLKDV